MNEDFVRLSVNEIEVLMEALQLIDTKDEDLIHKSTDERNNCIQSMDPCKNLETCHEYDKKIYGKNFDLAFDTHPDRLNIKHGHVGAHQHIHWAEEFIKRMEIL